MRFLFLFLNLLIDCPKILTILQRSLLNMNFCYNDINIDEGRNNMKKALTFALIGVIAIGSCVFAAEYSKFSKGFIKKFQDCDPYEETVNSEFEGQTFSTHRKIIGWRNGMCKYEETITSPKEKYKLNCSFTTIQVDDLYDAMIDKSKEPKKHELEMFVEQKDPKTGKPKYVVIGTQTIKGNRAYIVWAKYQNNPYFCKPQKL